VNFSISRPIQILALVGLLAAVAGGGMMLLTAKPQATSAPPTVAELRARAHAHARATATTQTIAKHVTTKPAAAKHASKAHTVATAKPAPAKKTAARPAVVKPAVVKPAVVKPAAPKAKPTIPAPTVAANGLPMALAKALETHKVVIVSLFDPQSQTDAISYAEAKAGATDAGVGFLGVNLLDDTVTSPLTAVLPGGGLLPDPGVLVFSAPATLAIRLDGFADRDAVAQAAAQALSSQTASTP
jgi:hypothetical protein